MTDTTVVELRTVGAGPTALGNAGPFALVVDRPVAAGGGGLGFNGAQLLYLAIAACISNDIHREAAALGVAISGVAVTVEGTFAGRSAASGPIDVDVRVESSAGDDDVQRLLDEVERVAEIPLTLRQPTPMAIRRTVVRR